MIINNWFYVHVRTRASSNKNQGNPTRLQHWNPIRYRVHSEIRNPLTEQMDPLLKSQPKVKPVTILDQSKGSKTSINAEKGYGIYIAKRSNYRRVWEKHGMQGKFREGSSKAKQRSRFFPYEGRQVMSKHQNKKQCDLHSPP